MRFYPLWSLAPTLYLFKDVPDFPELSYSPGRSRPLPYFRLLPISNTVNNTQHWLDLTGFFDLFVLYFLSQCPKLAGKSVG